MSQENQQNTEGLGEYLRRQREIRGFSLEEIAEQTKISLRALRALEAEDWEILPAEIYVRGFIRCYCETIGLDPNEAILRFEQVYRPFKQQDFSLNEKEGLPGNKKRSWGWLLVLVVILVLLAVGYYFFYRPTSQKAPELLPFKEPTKEKTLEERPKTLLPLTSSTKPEEKAASEEKTQEKVLQTKTKEKTSENASAHP